MEILQTIWNALTNENEMLVNILSIPLSFIEAFITTLLFTTILKIKSTKKQKALYVVIFAIIGLISQFIIPSPYNTFVNVLVCPILVIIIFKTNILKAILAEIIPYIIFVALGSIILNICVTIVKIPVIEFIKIPIAKTSCSLIMYFIAYILYLILNKQKISIKIFENFKKSNKFILIMNVFIGIIAIAMQSYLANLYSHFIPISTTTISIAILVIYFAFSMYSLIRTSKLEITTQNLEEEKLYNKTITILYDNIRGFKHNFNNIVQALGGYISTNNMEGLENYYKDLLDDSQKTNNLAVLNPSLINSPAVYSILTSKYHESDKLGIKMNLDIFLDMENLNIKPYDLTIILGILLDNAIDASKESKEKEINVTIRKDDKLNRNLFIIENTYSNKDVDIDRIFEKGYTSKKDENTQSHGLGLWNVRKIIKKYNNLNLYTNKDKKLFKQQLELYY